MFLIQATNAGGKILQLNTELIQVIEKIKTVLDADGQDLSWGQILLELYRNRDSQSARAAVIDIALTELDIPVAQLNKRLGDLQGYLVDLQSAIEPLLQKLGTPGELLNADIGYTPENKQLDVGQVAFVIGGSASAGITIRSFNTSQPPQDWTGELQDNSALQELSLAGQIAFNGSGRGAFGSVGINLSTAMSASGSLKLYHEYNAETTRIAALIMAAGNWATPWDLLALHEQLQSPAQNGVIRGFRRVQVHGNGSIEFAGGVDVGYAYQFEHDIPTPEGEQPLGVKADVQASLSVGFKRTGAFTYRIDKDLGNNLMVRVDRSSTNNSSLALNLDADLEISGLDQIAGNYVKAFFKDPQKLLDKLQDWTRPGDMLIDAFKKQDWDDPVIQQVGLLLLGESNAKELSAVAVGKLKSLLAQALNEKIPFWDENPQQITSQLLTLVAQRLDLNAELASSLNDVVADKIEQRIGDIHNKLEKQLQTVLEQAQDVGTEILEPLEHVGIKVQELLEKANVTAAELINPVIAYLKRYQDLRNKVLGALQQVARFKIGLNLMASINRQRQQTALLSFRIVTVNEATRAVHRAFLLGRLNQAWAEFEQARDKGWIDQIDGVFSAESKREVKVGFSLHFGDFGGIDRTRMMAEQLHVQVDPAGNILAASTQLSQQAVVDAFHVERSIGLIGSYDLVAASRDPQQVPAPLSFNLGYQDGVLRSSELRQFLRSLEQNRAGHPLLPVGAADATVQRYEELRTQHGLTKTGGRIDIALPISLEDLGVLVEVRNELIRDRAIQVQADLMLREQDQQQQLKSFAAGFKGGMDEVSFILEVARLGQTKAPTAIVSNLNLNAAITPAFSPIRQFVRRLILIADNAEAMVTVVNGIRDIAQLQKQLRVLPDKPPAAISEQLERQLAAATEQINNGLARWLKVRGVISGLFTEALPEQTIAFLSLLSELSPDHTQLVPIVKVDDVEGGTILVA